MTAPIPSAEPRIANRSDALDVLDELIEDAELDGATLYRVKALRALRDAIERGLI